MSCRINSAELKNSMRAREVMKDEVAPKKDKAFELYPIKKGGAFLC